MDLTDWGDIKLSYYALAVAILNPCRVEVAFEKVQNDLPSKVKPSNLTVEDKFDIFKLRKEGVKVKNICDIYGISETKYYKALEGVVNYD